MPHHPETRASEREERWTILICAEHGLVNSDQARLQGDLGLTHHEPIFGCGARVEEVEVVPAALLTQLLEAIDKHQEVVYVPGDPSTVARALGHLHGRDARLATAARSIRAKLSDTKDSE